MLRLASCSGFDARRDCIESGRLVCSRWPTGCWPLQADLVVYEFGESISKKMPLKWQRAPCFFIRRQPRGA